MKSALTLFMQKIQSTTFWTIIASEVTHIFCCVLPTIVSILSLLSGMGLITTMPGWLGSFHEVMHEWEVPVIIGSGILLALGWVLYAISRRIDCLTDADCHHEPCAPKKKHASRILMIATVLFVTNSTVYFVFHRAMNNDMAVTMSGHSESHQGHIHHD